MRIKDSDSFLHNNTSKETAVLKPRFLYTIRSNRHISKNTFPQNLLSFPCPDGKDPHVRAEKDTAFRFFSKAISGQLPWLYHFDLFFLKCFIAVK